MSIYLGRIVAVGKTREGHNAGVYRVSSRSFPNRRIAEMDGNLAVVPRPGFEGDVFKNPYIAYNCVRTAGKLAVLTNGSHTDPIAEKLLGGMGPKDSLASVMLALDYEKDHLKTPRIAAVLPASGTSAWLAIARHDALVVKEVRLRNGAMWYLSTYEANDVREAQCVEIAASTAEALAQDACRGAGFAAFANPVAAASAIAEGKGFAMAIHNMEAEPA
jgi:IMP cyclohydrolase